MRVGMSASCRHPPNVFDAEVPLLIVGAGAAGLCAALAAKEAGVEPIVIERDAVPAGSTALSAGLIPAAGHALPARQGHRRHARTVRADIQRKAHGEADPALVESVANAPARRSNGWPIATACRSMSSTTSTIPAIRRMRMHGLPTRSGAELIDRLRSAAEATRRHHPDRTRASNDCYVGHDGRIRGVEIDAADGARETIGCDALDPGLQRLWRQCRRSCAATSPKWRDALYFGHPGNQGDAVAVGRSALGAELAHLVGLSGPRLGGDAAQHPDHLGDDHGRRLSGQRAGPPLLRRIARLFRAGGAR